MTTKSDDGPTASAEREIDALRPIEIVGDVVRRPAQAWTPTVHAFLRHLRSAGLDCVPEPIGIDAEIETLGYLPGASGRDGWFASHSLDGLTSAARLLRRIHDASVGWVPPVEAVWAALPTSGQAADGAETVLCHGDPGPWNFVWDGERAVGLIDWDFLHPGSRLDDVAYALRWFAPARSDEHALDWHHFPEVPDRRERIKAFLTAYGDLPAFDRVEAIARRMEATMAVERAFAEAGVEPQRTWVAEGHLDDQAAEVAWVHAHRALLE
ncbi:phosphotransferase enzyme family protein [Nocardioides cynanchi]|uniref:phosphotransferase enzyme family protein n=1 Tax=Nocardioides cynanchi TaxID=2558918 RepID=UPI0012453C62|nr:aminoglycoside phosphotransferase family protein [Nocardioides cynanchi]